MTKLVRLVIPGEAYGLNGDDRKLSANFQYDELYLEVIDRTKDDQHNIVLNEEQAEQLRDWLLVILPIAK